MSERGEPHQRRIREVLEEVQRLRARGARERLGVDLDDQDTVPPPPGGWKPILDDDGNVIPDPPPSEPTDVPADDVAAARDDLD